MTPFNSLWYGGGKVNAWGGVRSDPILLVNIYVLPYMHNYSQKWLSFCKGISPPFLCSYIKSLPPFSLLLFSSGIQLSSLPSISHFQKPLLLLPHSSQNKLFSFHSNQNFNANTFSFHCSSYLHIYILQLSVSLPHTTFNLHLSPKTLMWLNVSLCVNGTNQIVLTCVVGPLDHYFSGFNTNFRKVCVRP